MSLPAQPDSHTFCAKLRRRCRLCPWFGNSLDRCRQFYVPVLVIQETTQPLDRWRSGRTWI